MAVEPGDAAEVAAIDKAQAELEARRDALALRWGEGAVVMAKPGDSAVMIVQRGKVRTVKVTYLSGGGS